MIRLPKLVLVLLMLSGCNNISDKQIIENQKKIEASPYEPKEYVEINHPEWSKNATIYEVNIRQYTPEGEVLDTEIDAIAAEFDNSNKQIQALAQAIDDSILNTYKLWPTNYIAYDLLHNTTTYAHWYTDKEKSLFERRLEIRIDENNPVEMQGFLAMYANPVINKSRYQDAHKS